MEHPVLERVRLRGETHRRPLVADSGRPWAPRRLRKSPRTQSKGNLEKNGSSTGKTVTHRITVTEGKTQRVGRLLIRVQRKRRHRGQYRVILVEDGALPTQRPGD